MREITKSMYDAARANYLNALCGGTQIPWLMYSVNKFKGAYSLNFEAEENLNKPSTLFIKYQDPGDLYNPFGNDISKTGMLNYLLCNMSGTMSFYKERSFRIKVNC